MHTHERFKKIKNKRFFLGNKLEIFFFVVVVFRALSASEPAAEYFSMSIGKWPRMRWLSSLYVYQGRLTDRWMICTFFFEKKIWIFFHLDQVQNEIHQKKTPSFLNSIDLFVWVPSFDIKSSLVVATSSICSFSSCPSSYPNSWNISWASSSRRSTKKSELKLELLN